MDTGALGYTALGRLSYSVTWSLGYNGSTPEERGVSMGRQRGPSSPANGACASAGRSSQAESDPEPAVMRPTGRGANKIGGASVSAVRVPTRGSPANHRRRKWPNWKWAKEGGLTGVTCRPHLLPGPTSSSAIWGPDGPRRGKEKNGWMK